MPLCSRRTSLRAMSQDAVRDVADMECPSGIRCIAGLVCHCTRNTCSACKLSNSLPRARRRQAIAIAIIFAAENRRRAPPPNTTVRQDAGRQPTGNDRIGGVSHDRSLKPFRNSRHCGIATCPQWRAHSDDPHLREMRSAHIRNESGRESVWFVARRWKPPLIFMHKEQNQACPVPNNRTHSAKVCSPRP